MATAKEQCGLDCSLSAGLAEAEGRRCGGGDGHGDFIWTRILEVTGHDAEAARSNSLRRGELPDLIRNSAKIYCESYQKISACALC